MHQQTTGVSAFSASHRVTCVRQIDLGARPQVMRKPPLSADDWSKHQDPEGRMTNVPHLKEAIFKGVRSLIISCSHHPLTQQEVCDHVLRDPAGTLSCCEERSMEVSAGILPLGQHAGGEESLTPS